jgi:hypothetical protein
MQVEKLAMLEWVAAYTESSTRQLISYDGYFHQLVVWLPLSHTTPLPRS